MKLYLLNGTYYEKQADVPKGQGKFEVIEFPFSASPKADFVNWMNDQPSTLKFNDAEGNVFDTGVERPNDPDFDAPLAKPTPAPQQPPSQSPNWKADSVLVWVLDEAKPAQIEQLFSALGARFHEATR